MEQAFIKIRKRNDELTEENREYVDSPTSPKIGGFIQQTDNVVKLREEFRKKEVVNNERIIEMVSEMVNGLLNI